MCVRKGRQPVKSNQSTNQPISPTSCGGFFLRLLLLHDMLVVFCDDDVCCMMLFVLVFGFIAIPFVRSCLRSRGSGAQGAPCDAYVVVEPYEGLNSQSWPWTVS